MRGSLNILAVVILISANTLAQTPLHVIDNYCEAVSKAQPDISLYFFPDAKISSIVYDSNGVPNHVHQSVAEFNAQLRSINADFEMSQSPMVLVYREYETVASVFCSFHIKFKDRESGEFFSTTTVQSIKFIYSKNRWLISQFSVQNEHPSYPIDEKLKPERLQAKHRENALEEMQRTPRPIDDFSTEYDPNQVYHINEVDQKPEYPTGNDDLLKLCTQFDISLENQMGYTPFIVTIAEDGTPTLSYTHDLSSYQISRAESFVRSMLFWHPAVKYAANVKCKILFYIRD